MTSWFGANTSDPRKAAPLERRHTDMQAVDVSLMERLDGGWMGGACKSASDTLHRQSNGLPPPDVRLAPCCGRAPCSWPRCRWSCFWSAPAVAVPRVASRWHPTGVCLVHVRDEVAALVSEAGPRPCTKVHLARAVVPWPLTARQWLQGYATVTLRKALVHAPLHETSAFRAADPRRRTFGGDSHAPAGTATPPRRMSDAHRALGGPGFHRRQLSTVDSEPLALGHRRSCGMAAAADPLALSACTSPTRAAGSATTTVTTAGGTDLSSLAACTLPAASLSAMSASAFEPTRSNSQASAYGFSGPLSPRKGGGARRGGARTNTPGGSFFQDARDLASESDGGASQPAEDDALLHVPAASRAVMSRLMRQRRALHERAHRERATAAAAPPPPRRRAAPAPGRTRTQPRRDGSADSATSASSSASLGSRRYDSDGGVLDAAQRPPWRRSGEQQRRHTSSMQLDGWPPADAPRSVDSSQPHADITSAFFT